jgi:hypothetical protein
MMYSILLLTLLAPAAPDHAAVGAMSPEQGVAVIDGDGKLRITIVSGDCYGMPNREIVVDVADKPGGEKIAVKAKVKVTSVMVTTTEMPAKLVEAYSVDGKAIERKKLAELLAKERTVLVAADGKKVDPFFLQLYKDDAVVLVPPPNTMSPAGLGGNQIPMPALPVQPPLEEKRLPANPARPPQ